jgi:hypothetical protein
MPWWGLSALALLICAVLGVLLFRSDNRIEAVALGNITQQALASYNMNMYVYKEIEGEMQKLNIAEYFQILGDRDVDLMKKLTLIGIFEK